MEKSKTLLAEENSIESRQKHTRMEGRPQFGQAAVADLGFKRDGFQITAPENFATGHAHFRSTVPVLIPVTKEELSLQTLLTRALQSHYFQVSFNF